MFGDTFGRPVKVLPAKRIVKARENTGSRTNLPDHRFSGLHIYRTRIDFQEMRLVAAELIESTVDWQSRLCWPWVYFTATNGAFAQALVDVTNRTLASKARKLNKLPALWRVIAITLHVHAHLPNCKTYSPPQSSTMLDTVVSEVAADTFYVCNLTILSRQLARDLLRMPAALLAADTAHITEHSTD